MRMPPWRSLSAAAVVLGWLPRRWRSSSASRMRMSRALAPRQARGAPRGAGSSARLGPRSRSASASSSSSRRRRLPTGCGKRAAWPRTRPSDAGRRRRSRARSSSSPSLPRRASRRGPICQFTRVVNGFSAVADPSAVVLLERSPRVAGVYPVRAAFPAAMAQTSDVAAPLPAAPAAYRGTGITVALLDTAVDPATPYLHGRVSSGFDVLDGGAAARYDQRPGRRPAGDARHRDGRHRRRPRPSRRPSRGRAGRRRSADSRRRLAARRRGKVVDPRPDRPDHRRPRASGRPEPERRRARCGAHHADPAVRAVLGVPGQRAVPRGLRSGRARLARRRPGGQRRPGGPGFGSIGGPGERLTR